MALNDIRIISGAVEARPYQVASGAVGSIVAGEPVKATSDGSPYVILCATGDPEVGTDKFIGIAANTSTDTAAADGKVDVLRPIPGVTVMECKATTFANVDTQAELDALIGDAVTFDLTGTVFTVDENEGHYDNVHGLILVGGDVVKGTMQFVLKAPAMDTASII